MIPYAGHEGKRRILGWTGEMRGYRILSMFRAGMDTMQIAKELGWKESTVYNELHRAREAEREKGL
jgi:IS30 family transposase